MKKLFLVGALALFGAMNAQFGLKAGLNIASIDNFAEDQSSRIGFYGGVFYNAPLSSSIKIQPELLYNSKGVKGEGELDDEGETTASLNLDYISIPVMFQYNVTPEFYFEVGPEFSILASAKYKMLGMSFDVKEGFNTFDVGLGIGAGYYFKPVNLGLTARYTVGFIDTFKDYEESSKNGAFQIGLAYKFKK
ncbi:MAG: PorT family protein [Flavobacteriaceae bacterium]|jgi:hypothetical protein|nr:PorT family protein [Flavobacteriaceae bacterium]